MSHIPSHAQPLCETCHQNRITLMWAVQGAQRANNLHRHTPTLGSKRRLREWLETMYAARRAHDLHRYGHKRAVAS